MLPYTAESYPLRIRGRATGWVAGVSKSGGLVCQGLSSLALVPVIGTAAVETVIPVLLGLGLVALYGRETRGRDLRALETIS
jgi:putative MFS transporter